MSKPTKLSEAVAFIDRELRNSYRDKPDDDWCLICGENQPRDRPHLESCQWAIIVAELAAKDAEIARLREALKPFADRYRKWLDDAGLDDLADGPVDALFSVEEFRAAAKAMGEDR